VFLNQNWEEKLEFLGSRVENLDSSILALNKIYVGKLGEAKSLISEKAKAILVLEGKYSKMENAYMKKKQIITGLEGEIAAHQAKILAAYNSDVSKFQSETSNFKVLTEKYQEENFTLNNELRG
jgi:K+/H+ antiporter YhaU regulatory subunit KhtT